MDEKVFDQFSVRQHLNSEQLWCQLI